MGDTKTNSTSLLLKTLDPEKNLFDDSVYEIALSPKGNKLPPVREYDHEDSTSGSNGSEFGARTPRISSPRTPRATLISLQEEEAIIRKRRNEFFVNTLLMEINFDNIVDMKKAFDSAGGGVSLSQFVQIMIKAVAHKKEQENSIMARLFDLFAEIDIDGDKEMTWEEFTSFIIKSGIEPFDPTKSMKKYQEIFTRHEIVCNNLSKIRYFPQIDKVVICDNNKEKLVQVYKSEIIKYQTEYLLHKELRFHTGSILNAEYIPNKKYLVTSSSDCILAFWDVDSWRKKAEGITPVPQTVLLWYAPHDCLFTGGLDGNIYTWMEYYSEKEKSLKWKIKQVYRGHTDMVTAIVNIPNTPIIVSSSTDSSIFTWDVITTMRQKDLKGHVKGVYSLAYSHEHRFLISAGSDRDALVWNPLVKNRPIFRLKGHTSSLIHVEVIEGTPQIITADCAGVLKLWDIRNFECVQTFDTTSQFSELISFTCSVNAAKPSGPHNQLLVGGNNKIMMFEYDKPGTPWLSMQSPLIAVIYNHHSSTILTAGGDTIKIWDAKTGRLLRVYSGLCDSSHNVSLSSVCLDSSQKKIFTGDTDGNLHVYNYSNGAILRKLDSHKSLISQLIFCPQSKCIISASWDALLNVHDELDFNKKGRSVLRSTNSHKKDITVAAFAESLSLIAVGTSDGSIWLWDFEKCGFEGKLEPNTEEITALIFLVPFPILCSADNHANLTFWTVKPSLNKNHLLLRVPHTKDITGNIKPTIVSALNWDKDQKYLYCGDELGQITIWNLRSLVNRDGITTGRAHKNNLKGSSIITGTMSQSTFSLLDDYSYKPIKPATRADVVLVTQWSAHYSAITYLELIEVPSAILSASKDRRVRAWDRSGKYYGTLRQAEGSTRTWNFPLDDGIRKEAETKKVEEIQSLLEKKETRKTRRYKTVAVYDKPSIPSNGSPTSLDLLQLIDNNIASKEDSNETPREAPAPITPTSMNSTHPSLKRDSSSSMKIKKPWVNPWYQITQSRIRGGDPDLDKFNPNQPGQFPNLIQGLPLPEVRPLPHPLVFPATKGKNPFQVEDDKPSTYYDLLKLSQADKILNPTQLSAAKKLSMVLEQLDNEDNK